ncbi:MAG: phosphotransferase [Anaerolineales bacterium]|nr:phosphotransferase [Anaerolineales bacterium]
MPNPLLSYQNLLRDFLPVKNSTIHGDLNLENILVDPATREVSLIDFATVRQGHVLHDLLRLETEVLVTLIPPILAEIGWPAETIVPVYEQLYQTILSGDDAVSPVLPHLALGKPFEMLRVIRKMARKCLYNLDDWREYYRGLILYLLGALKFKALDDLPTAPLPKQVAFWGAATAQHWLETPISQPRSRPTRNRPPAEVRPEKMSFEIEPPFGTMRPDSPFYIEREADEQCWRQLTSPYAATLFAQAPMQTGKSSLMHRMLYRVKQSGEQQHAYIDFQKFTEQYLADEENFFIQLCVMIGDALGLPEAIDQYWSGRRTHIIKCSHYMTDYIIPRLKGSFILAMDEVERMQGCPFKGNFFGMLRTWHNDRVDNEHFAQMTLFLSSSTDPYLLIDNPNQSPFNVATPITLQDFILGEMAELNRRHHLPLNQGELDQLMDLVGGHPFLTRLALYLLAIGKVELPALLAHATEDNGPFGEHLRHYLRRVLRKPDLKQALALVVHQRSLEENDVFHRLREAGLIKRLGQQVVFRNNLYERYFKERLNG